MSNLSRIMVECNKDIIGGLIKKARESERKRFIHTFHKTDAEMQRMLNAIEPESYVRPHRHSHTFEIFVIIKGRVVLITFDDNGNIKEKVTLDKETPCVEIPINTWHSMIALEEAVVYIVMEGPYDENTHKEFAPWSPEEKTELGNMFVNELRKKL